MPCRQGSDRGRQMSGALALALHKEPFQLTTLLPLLCRELLAHHSVLFHQIHKPKVIAVEKPAEHISPLSHSDQNVISHLLSDLLLPSSQREAQQSHGYRCLGQYCRGYQDITWSSATLIVMMMFGLDVVSIPHLGPLRFPLQAYIMTPPPK